MSVLVFVWTRAALWAVGRIVWGRPCSVLLFGLSLPLLLLSHSFRCSLRRGWGAREGGCGVRRGVVYWSFSGFTGNFLFDSMGSKVFFPELWADDDQMVGLMSMIKVFLWLYFQLTFQAFISNLHGVCFCPAFFLSLGIFVRHWFFVADLWTFILQAREVNPNDYDRKIEFWSSMIAKSCSIDKNPVFNIEILKRRFRRGDQIPGSLDIVVQHMLE